MAIGKIKKEMMEMNWGGDDDDGPTKKNVNNNSKNNNNNNRSLLTSSPGLSATANQLNPATLKINSASHENDDDDMDSEDELDVADLESDSPLRVHYSTILYAVSDQPKTIVADRDSSE